MVNWTEGRRQGWGAGLHYLGAASDGGSSSVPGEGEHRPCRRTKVPAARQRQRLVVTRIQILWGPVPISFTDISPPPASGHTTDGYTHRTTSELREVIAHARPCGVYRTSAGHGPRPAARVCARALLRFVGVDIVNAAPLVTLRQIPPKLRRLCGPWWST
jgi:hypothetical protein